MYISICGMKIRVKYNNIMCFVKKYTIPLIKNTDGTLYYGAT